MIYSMTGYAVTSRDLKHGSLTLELKSVNSRFLDVVMRLAEDCRSVEMTLREIISGRLARGKVECRVNYIPSQGQSTCGSLNPQVLEGLTKHSVLVRQRFPDAAPLSVADILHWPNILLDSQESAEDLRDTCVELCHEALEELIASRAREGMKLAAILRERMSMMRVRVAAVAPLLPAVQAAFEERLRRRMVEALGSDEDERIRQEMVLFATRIDVEEELSRLSVHLDEVERVITKGGPVGKRLDFLMQELNREANTLGSKSLASEISATSMELKVNIEQMREQVQNLE